MAEFYNEEMVDRILPGIDKEHFAKALEAAKGKFWDRIVDHYPEVQSGDFPPDCTIEIGKAMEKAVIWWLYYNHPKYQEKDEI